MDSLCRNILLVTSCISLGLDLIAVLYLTITDMNGFSPVSVDTLCNNYLETKFPTNRPYYSACFAGALVAMVCLTTTVILEGLSRCQEGDYLKHCYLFLSGAITGLVVLSGGFLTLIVEQSSCLGGVNADWAVLASFAWAALLPAIAAWIITLFLLNRTDSVRVPSETVSFGGESPTPIGKMFLGYQQLEDNRSILTKHNSHIIDKDEPPRDNSRFIQAVPRHIEQEHEQAQISWQINSFGQTDPVTQKQILHPLSPKSPKIQQQVQPHPKQTKKTVPTQNEDSNSIVVSSSAKKIRKNNIAEVGQKEQKEQHKSVGRQGKAIHKGNRTENPVSQQQLTKSARSEEKKSTARQSMQKAPHQETSPFSQLIQADELKQEELQMLIFSRHSSMVQKQGEELAFSKSRKVQRKKLFKDTQETSRRRDESVRDERLMESRIHRSTRDEQILRVLREKLMGEEGG